MGSGPAQWDRVDRKMGWVCHPEGAAPPGPSCRVPQELPNSGRSQHPFYEVCPFTDFPWVKQVCSLCVLKVTGRHSRAEKRLLHTGPVGPVFMLSESLWKDLPVGHGQVWEEPSCPRSGHAAVLHILGSPHQGGQWL